MNETNAISVREIVRDIIELTDHLNSKEELKTAWREIRLALDYLSAKDSMFRSREELQEKLKKYDSDR
tara:strand:- start:1275 stop:1478 length:204 start_codon:yes stop_codon:yes gene_type:complete